MTLSEFMNPTDIRVEVLPTVLSALGYIMYIRPACTIVSEFRNKAL